MRQLSPGDVAGKLARIESADRSRRWKKRATAKLLKDLKAEYVPGTKHLDTPRGRVCAKRRFPSFIAAFNALTSAWASPNPNRHETRVYPCKHCQQWHITSKPYEANRNDREEEVTHYHRRPARQGEGGGDSGPGDQG